MADAIVIERRISVSGALSSLWRLDTIYVAFAVGAAIRLIGIDRLSMWLDEAYSVELARMPLAQIWQVGFDVHPPLYYSMLHFWLMFGSSYGWIRLLSALFGLLTIPLVYQLGRVLAGPAVGTAAGWFVALSPWHIWYSQEARMYAALCCMGVLSLLCGALWLRSGTFIAALGFALSTIAGLYLDHTMLFLWPVEVSLLLLLNRKQTRTLYVGGWIVLQAIVMVGYWPLLPLVQGQLASIIAPEYIMARLGLDLNMVAAIGLGAAAGLAVLALLAGLFWRRRPALAARIVQWGLALVLPLSLAFMLVPTASTVKRMLLVLLPLGLLGAAWALQRLDKPVLSLRNMLVVSLVALVALFVTTPKEPWREVVADVTSQVAANDILLIQAGWMYTPWDYYSQGQVQVVGVEPAKLGAALEEQLASHQRVWLILSQHKRVDPDGKVRAWLDERFDLGQSHEYYQITTLLYERPASAGAVR